MLVIRATLVVPYVLAYIPPAKAENPSKNFSDIMLLEGMEKTPRRYTIPWSNKWTIACEDLCGSFLWRCISIHESCRKD